MYRNCKLQNTNCHLYIDIQKPIYRSGIYANTYQLQPIVQLYACSFCKTEINVHTIYTLNASIQFDIYMLWAPHVRKISLSV